MVSMKHVTDPPAAPPPDLDQLPLTCSVPVAAKLLGIGRATAYKAAAEGSLPSIRVGRRIVVPTAALRRMLDAGSPILNESEDRHG